MQFSPTLTPLAAAGLVVLMICETVLTLVLISPDRAMMALPATVGVLAGLFATLACGAHCGGGSGGSRCCSESYHGGVPVVVTMQTVIPRKLAAVRREVAPGAVGSAWGSALDKVWEFIRNQPGLWSGGHNIFLYQHPNESGAPIVCDFGVEVTRAFETAGEVYATETPAGEAAVAIHRGPYNRMNEAYTAIEEWMRANQRESAGRSWEIYGDPTPNPAETETTIVHLLK